MNAPAVPAWITDPDLIASIVAGYEVIPDEFYTPPAPQLSPIAGAFNAFVAWLNDRLAAHAVLLEAEVAVALAENQQLKGEVS
ncbi:hypothetical protein [Streptomyces sp. NPDC047990]|uniref:hypothetical protein n=1 Tax=Streptomyces sp. NPDC047990 TaxID=3365496 RepID=UPI00371B4861